MSSNTWVNNDQENREWAPHGPPQEQHVPVRAFNALEMRDTLKNGMKNTKSLVAHI